MIRGGGKGSAVWDKNKWKHQFRQFKVFPSFNLFHLFKLIQSVLYLKLFIVHRNPNLLLSIFKNLFSASVGCSLLNPFEALTVRGIIHAGIIYPLLNLTYSKKKIYVIKSPFMTGFNLRLTAIFFV